MNSAHHDAPPEGFRVVLTADRLLMSDFPVLLDGMAAASMTTALPAWFMRRFLCPPVPVEGIRASLAPLGLRKIEAALLEAGFRPEEVAVVPPDRVARAVGRATKAVLVSSGDPRSFRS